MITNLKLTSLTADLVKDRLEALGLTGLPSQVADQLAQDLSEDIAANAKKLARKINERHIAKAILGLAKRVSRVPRKRLPGVQRGRSPFWRAPLLSRPAKAG